VEVKGEALYRLGLRLRRDRRFTEAAEIWQEVLGLAGTGSRTPVIVQLRQFAAEALAIHREHRERDFDAARELALFALKDEPPAPARVQGLRHRLARLDRKIARRSGGLFS
jgi:hypothetical protein